MKRILLPLAVLAAAAIVLLTAGGGRGRPALLLVTLDTTRWDHLSCYDGDGAETPRIDALAEAGVLFVNAEAHAPITLPSHTSILTGVFPPDHGVRDNGTFALRPEAETVPERLKAAGYRTGAFVSSVILDSKYGLDQGFDVYDDDFEVPLDQGTQYPVSRRAAETVGKALDWVREQGEDEPVFLWVHLYDPHAPYEPPPPYDRAYRDSPYRGEIAYADLQLAPLFEEFRAREGVTVVTADHGDSFGEHEERTHGFFVYESTLRVPLVVAGGPFTGGRRIEAPVRSVDIPATLLALAGIDVPEGLRGRDLLDVVEGRVDDLPGYGEAWIPTTFGWSGLRSLRIGDRKLVQGSRVEIHDLTRPDGEESDIAPANPEERDRLLARLEETLAIPTPGGGGPRALETGDVEDLLALGYLGAAGGGAAAGEDVVRPDREDPRDRIGVFNRILNARAHQAEGRAEKAIEIASKAVAEEPVNPYVRFERAQILLRSGRGDAALDDLRFAAEGIPEDPRPLNQIAEILGDRGEKEEAEEVLRAARERDPNHYYTLFNLGLLLLDREEWEEAEQVYRHALRVSRESPRAMNNLACALIRGDLNREEGFRLLERAVQIAPRDGEIRLSLADAYLNADRPDVARTHLDEASRLLGETQAVKTLRTRLE